MQSINRPIYSGSVLLKLSADDHWFHFRVRSRKGKHTRSFYCSREAFMKWLDAGERTYLEMDCSNLLKANVFNEQLILEFHGLNGFSDKTLQGYIDSVYLSKNEFLLLLTQNSTSVVFSYQHRFDKPARFDFSHANDTLQRVIQSREKRRALCKLLSVRNGGYTGDVTRVYNDGRYDFYFINTMSNGRSYNGGIILHEGVSAEGYPKVFYSVHT